MLNIGIVTFIILSICIFLYYKYKGKLSPMQRMLKEREKKQGEEDAEKKELKKEH